MLGDIVTQKILKFVQSVMLSYILQNGIIYLSEGQLRSHTEDKIK